MKIMIYFFLLILSFKVHAVSSLTDQLNDFFKKEYAIGNNINIIVRTPLKKNIFCKKPVFSLLSNFQPLGVIDVLLTCSKKRYYLQVEIQNKGEYIAANRKIPRGTKIQESDLKILIGRLDTLPNNTYRKKKDVIDRVNLRDVCPLEPITSFMTRPFWLVQFNQQVTVIIHGKNFTIFYKAKALNNGAKNDKIRVKIKTGKIITGIVNQDGEVVVSL